MNQLVREKSKRDHIESAIKSLKETFDMVSDNPTIKLKIQRSIIMLQEELRNTYAKAEYHHSTEHGMMQART